MNARPTLLINAKGHLEIGGVDTVELAASFPTPVYVYDEAYIRLVMASFAKAVSDNYGAGVVAYASKAFSCKAIYSIAKSEGLYADVVSIGEFMTAKEAGFDLSRVIFHGNNKQIYEIAAAIRLGVGRFAVDGLDEIGVIDKLAGEARIKQKVLLRVNPGVDAHTHRFIQTATTDSKFGFSVMDGTAAAAVRKILAAKNLAFDGINCHIGSQIFDKTAFLTAADIMTDFILTLQNERITVNTLDLGGGFGIYYGGGDPKFSPDEYYSHIKAVCERVKQAVEVKKIAQKPFLIFEPGRSIVGEAGITLYTVGGIKSIPNIKKYVAVDGGMADNIRPALYDAKYEAVVANKANAAGEEVVSIAGRCCESADILIKDICLPKVERGNIIAILSTGAYGYSMASNYNRIPKPGVLLVKDGKAEYIVKPESVSDLISHDQTPPWLK